MGRGNFIVLDGPEGTGKTSIKRKFQELFPNIVAVREPGGTPLSEVIRSELFGIAGGLTPIREFMYFFAARANLLQHVIEPALLSGRNVITDRFDSSTYAYQVVGPEMMELDPIFWEIRNELIVKPKLQPDLYLIIDVPVQIGLARRHAEGGKTLNHIDQRTVAFHSRVQRGFREFAVFVPNVVFVDGTRSLEEVTEECLSHCAPLLKSEVHQV